MSDRALKAALALAATALLSLAPGAQRAGGATAPARRPAAAHTSAAATPRPVHAAAMPDTVLARVKFADGETFLTATDFRTGALKLGANPDSLAPENRRQLLDMLVQQAALNHRIAQSPPQWLHRDSTNYSSFADGLTLRAAGDSAIADYKAHLLARGDTLPAVRVIAGLVRDSTLRRNGIVYDETAVDSLAAAFAALPVDDIKLPVDRRRDILSRQPQLSARDSARVLGHIAAGGYTAGELLRDRAGIGVLKRPKIRDRADVHAMVDDALFTLLLRNEAQRQHLERRPDIAAQLAVRHQFLTVQRFVQNEAYDQVPLDTATVARYFASEARNYDLPASARIVRQMLQRRSEADSAAARLATPGYAESLATAAVQPPIPYQTTLGENADTVLFARVLAGGVGAVIGPDETPVGWRVFKVMSTTPRKPQTVAEAFVRARADWLDVDGDRRMREMMAKLVAGCRVTTNDSSSYLTGRRRAPR